jgi:hypothetical protein
MTLLEIATQIIKEVQGGMRTVESKFSNEYIYSLIHAYRANVLRAQFSKSKRIHPLWTQQFYPEYSADLQDDVCAVKFQIPASIIMNEQTNGYLYIGEVAGNCAYKQLNSRAELSTYNQHRVSKQGVRIIYSDGTLEVYGNIEMKTLRVDGVFANPAEIPTFNPDFDNYPMDNESINQMKDIIVKAQLGKEAQTPADFKQNQLDETAIQAK